MATYPTEAINTPIGDLEWVLISGEGKEDLSGNMKYSASVVLDEDIPEHKAFLEKVETFWAENKPSKWKDGPVTTGIYDHKIPTDEKDEDGDTIYKETGKKIVRLSTKTTYTDGKPKVIPVFNAKGAEVALGEKKIANGSRGRCGGIMAIYGTTDKTGKKLINAGVTFYLNKVQLTKFVEYAGSGFDAIEDEDGDSFDGLDDQMGAVTDEAPATEKPRI